MRVVDLLWGLAERDSSLKFGTSFGRRESWRANVCLMETLEVGKECHLAVGI